MKILSATATFGKLSRQTLTFQEGLNIIQAPNEWGKSTWCAFLMAMLYGIDTRSQTKTGFLADKEHYKPWSGEPMSGSMEILWNGRKITIQRQNKRVTPLGEVKAFEMETGVPVPELCVPAPGQVLLGVERSVFERAGFLRLSEMPIKEDESLRRRLNELVTTGDESGASDALQEKLNKLKNKCKHNKTGLIPEAEAELKKVTDKLEQLGSLQYQISSIKSQQEAFTEKERRLENHKQALRYNEQKQYADKLTSAQMNRDRAEQAVSQAEAECQALPSQENIRQNLSRAHQLRDIRDNLHTKSQLLPPLPPVPEAPEVFRGKDPNAVVGDAKLDAKVLQQLKNDLNKPVPYIIGGVLAAIGVIMLVISQIIPAGAFLLLSVICFILGVNKQKKLRQQIADLINKYRNIPEDGWEQEAERYAANQEGYNKALAQRQALMEDLNRQLEENGQAISSITQGQSLFQYEELCRTQLQSYDRLTNVRNALQQAREVLQALSGAGEEVQPPAFTDTLTLTREETEAALAETAGEKHRLQHRLGQCQGQMDALGKEEALRAQKQQLTDRIAVLEKYQRALNLALDTLTEATLELQRRFAPRISGRAKDMFSRMTDGRYQRLILKPDLSVDSGAENEIGEQGTLWRSDGTVDQVYLALRMAVAEELTPNAPLILDDALVRFDDVRLAETLRILQEMAREKQIILFTCQSREQDILAKL